MRNFFWSIVSASALTLSCGKVPNLRNDGQQKEIESLRSDLADSDSKRNASDADLANAKRGLADKDAELAATKSAADSKAAEVEALSRAIEAEKAKTVAADTQTQALRVRYARHDAEVEELAKELYERDAALKTASSNNDALTAKTSELKKALEAAKAEREKVASELTAAVAAKDLIEKSLDEEKRVSLQVFLENSAPETMFGASGADVAAIFPRRGDDCAVVLDLDPEVKVLRANERTGIPDLHGYTPLSMRASYRKIAICRDGNRIEAQVEKGHLYRTISQMNDRAIISSRVSSSCDKQASDIQASALLGDSRYQMLTPFRGDMDGIETIDVPANDKTLRLHMGSALVGAINCAQAAKSGNVSDLVVIACAVAVEKPLEGISLVKGCFSRKTSWGRESTRFTAE